eukprot:3370263-Prymnesium_polylepis.1
MRLLGLPLRGFCSALPALATLVTLATRTAALAALAALPTLVTLATRTAALAALAALATLAAPVMQRGAAGGA